MLGEPQPIPVGQEPPPLRPSPSPNGANGRPARHQGTAKAKGKPARRKGDRFAVLNTFADFTLSALTLPRLPFGCCSARNTKPDGTGQTSQADLARRAGANLSTVKRAVAARWKPACWPWFIGAVCAGGRRHTVSGRWLGTGCRRQAHPPNDKGHGCALY